jgi:sporulation protein YlmC with PRC-barrel domain
MSDSSCNARQPADTTRLNLVNAKRALQRASHSLNEAAPSRQVQATSHAIEQAVRYTEQALQEAEAIIGEQQPEPKAHDKRQSDHAGAPEAPFDVADNVEEHVEAAADEPEEPTVAEVRPDESASRMSQEGLETYEAEIERAGEDKPLLESEARRYVGESVINPDGNELGVIQDVVVGPNGVVQGVVVDVGSLLGLPEHRVAIDWSEIVVSADDRLVIGLSPDEIQQLPQAQP